MHRLRFAALFLGAIALAPPARAQDGQALASLFDSATAAIKTSYFDPSRINSSLDTSASYRRRDFLPPKLSTDLDGEVNGLLSELHFSGCRFYREGQAPDFTPAFRARMTREGLTVLAVQPGSDCQAAGLLTGDVITTPAATLFGQRGSGVTLGVRATQGEWSRIVRRNGYDEPEPDYGWRLFGLNNKVAYLRINRITSPEGVDTALAALRSYPNVIVDVRYTRESDASVLRFLSRFTEGSVLVGYCANRRGMTALTEPLFRKVPERLAESTGDTWMFNPTLSERGLLTLRVLPGTQPMYAGRVIVLADEGTRGFAELIPDFFRRSHRGRVVGRITAGIGGIPSALKMEGGYTLEVPTAAIFRADGQLLEGNGVEPDYLSQWHQIDVKSGADPDVERALELLDSEGE